MKNLLMANMKKQKKRMTKNYKILAKYIKDMSSETPDAETYMYVKDNISRYQLGINIDSKAIKSRLIEIDTSIKFYDKEENVKKSIFEFVYTSVVQVDENLRDKLSQNARLYAIENYDVKNVCLPRQLKWVEDLSSK